MLHQSECHITAATLSECHYTATTLSASLCNLGPALSLLARIGFHAPTLTFAGLLRPPRAYARLSCSLWASRLPLRASSEPHALALTLVSLAGSLLTPSRSPSPARPGPHALTLASAGPLPSWPRATRSHLCWTVPNLTRSRLCWLTSIRVSRRRVRFGWLAWGVTLAFACLLRFGPRIAPPAHTFAQSLRIPRCLARLCWLASVLTLSRSLLLARVGLTPSLARGGLRVCRR